MNFKALTSAVTNKASRQLLKVRKHSPTLLFAAGVVGVGATVVLACRATLRVEEILDETQENLEKIEKAAGMDLESYDEKAQNKDKAIVYTKAVIKLGKLYGPAVLVGVASIAALTGSHVTLNNRLTGITAAYAALDRGFKQYRKRVVDELGEDKDREFRHGAVEREIVEETDQGPEVKTIKSFDPTKPSIYARFFDQMCKDWQKKPEYNLIFLKAQQNYANDMLRARGHLFLNEVYDRLDIPRTMEGQVVGWVFGGNGDDYVDFGIFDGTTQEARDFVNGHEGAILLDFNVDGPIYDKI